MVSFLSLVSVVKLLSSSKLGSFQGTTTHTFVDSCTLFLAKTETRKYALATRLESDAALVKFSSTSAQLQFPRNTKSLEKIPQQKKILRFELAFAKRLHRNVARSFRAHFTYAQHNFADDTFPPEVLVVNHQSVDEQASINSQSSRICHTGLTPHHFCPLPLTQLSHNHDSQHCRCTID